MRAMILMGCVMLLASTGCEKPNKGGEPQASADMEPAMRVTPDPGMRPRPVKRARPLVKIDPAERKRRVHKELVQYNPITLRYDATGLSAADKKLVKALGEAVSLVEELNMLQIHPKNLRYDREIAERGTADDKLLYLRYQRPWCFDDEHEACNAHPKGVAKQVGLYHWPKGMTDAEFKQISAAPNKKELLSNFTVVRRDGPGKWKAIPYAADKLLGPRMKKLAAKLREAATHTSEATLKKFLVSRAKAFEDKSPFPYDASDYDWIALAGKWEVNVGPYEVYKNPRHIKARFKMVFGLTDPKLTAELARFKKVLQQMENGLAKLVGPKIYKARKLDPRIAVRAIRVLGAGGDARAPKGATVAFHLPNRGKSVDEGLYKKVMLVNHSFAFSPIVVRRAALVLAVDQQKYVDKIAGITNTTFHEFSHGFGSHDELKIQGKDGKQTTVHEALKEHTTLMEELKADVTSFWLIAWSQKQGWLKPNQAKVRYVTGLMHILGLSGYPLKGTYPRMVAVQLGWYMDHGGVTWENGRFRVDFEKLPAAVESLTKKVATLQLTGDHAGASALIARYVKTVVPKKKYEYVGKIKAPLLQMKAAFKKANIKSVAISYQVTGL